MISIRIWLFLLLIIGSLCGKVDLSLTIPEIFDYYTSNSGYMNFSEFSDFILDYSGGSSMFSLIDVNQNEKLEYFELMYYLDTVCEFRNISDPLWFLEQTFINETILPVTEELMLDLDLNISTSQYSARQIKHEVVSNVIYFIYHMHHYDTYNEFADNDVITYSEWVNYYDTYVINEWDVATNYTNNANNISIDEFKQIIGKFDTIQYFITYIDTLLKNGNYYSIVNVSNDIIDEEYVMNNKFMYGFVSNPHKLDYYIIKIFTNIFNLNISGGSIPRRRLLDAWDDMWDFVGGTTTKEATKQISTAVGGTFVVGAAMYTLASPNPQQALADEGLPNENDIENINDLNNDDINQNIMDDIPLEDVLEDVIVMGDPVPE